MRPPLGLFFSASILVTSCLVSIGAVEFGPADIVQKITWPLAVLCATYHACIIMGRHAIATEAGTAETPQSGSVHEGAGRKASPKSRSS